VTNYLPALPVKKMFFPSATTNDRTFCCSSDSTTFCWMFITPPAELPADLVRLLPSLTVLVLDVVRIAFFVFLHISQRIDRQGQSTHPTSSSHGRARFCPPLSGMLGRICVPGIRCPDGCVLTCEASVEAGTKDEGGMFGSVMVARMALRRRSAGVSFGSKTGAGGAGGISSGYPTKTFLRRTLHVSNDATLGDAEAAWSYAESRSCAVNDQGFGRGE